MGERVVCRCTPQHLGRQTQVWDAQVTNETTGRTDLSAVRERLGADRIVIEPAVGATARLTADTERTATLTDVPIYARVDIVEAAGPRRVLELIEPELFFGFAPQATARLATVMLERS